MLRSLSIKNLAIIDALSLELGHGFTALTGETGAGKSILIDAIGLIAGTRADTNLIRAGAERAEVVAEFSLADAPAAAAWLRAQDLLDPAEPDTCVVRRILSAEGRTRAFINYSPASGGALKELGETLIEVFGQNESQTLLRAGVQRALLDGYGGYEPLLDEVREAARAWHQLRDEIDRLVTRGPLEPAQLDFQRHQLRELEALNLEQGEIERLDAEHKRLANAGRLLADGSLALERLYGGEASVYDLLASAAQLVRPLRELEAGFGEAEELIEGAQAQTHEAAQSLQRLLERLELDPAQLGAVEQRLSDIQDLARKHRVRPALLPERLAALRAEVEQAEQAAQGLEALEMRLAEHERSYQTAAAKLSEKRRAAAEHLSARVTALVRTLGMGHAAFVVAVEPAAQRQPQSYGQDEVRFDFSANPGQAPRPLAKVASGGELSRVSLAIQVVASQQAGPPTMIFDEVDAGIGGAVAEIVGSQLRRLGSHRQVLSVTHLAQVASHGRQHLSIYKEVRSGQTFTRVRVLDAAGRVEEIARMSGGTQVTASTEAHAREMLERAQSDA